MDFPKSLPGIIEYRCGAVVRNALPRTPVESVSSSGKTTACYVCPTIPIGADAWRLPGGEWKKLEDLPLTWLPFLNRKRPSQMDPRRPLAEIAGIKVDAIEDGAEL